LKVGRLRLPGERINKGFKGDYQQIEAGIFEATCKSADELFPNLHASEEACLP
jgi:hypothetical protein